jgi:quaternary ammonium compound-resistance protein SugE
VSPWAWLLTAGAAEVAWSQSIKPTAGFTRPVPTLICFVLAFAAIYPLTRAMQQIPVGTAYAVFTGMGSAGAVTLGVLISGDPISAPRLAGIALIVAGVVVLQRLASG